jgi:hypothetical protein
MLSAIVQIFYAILSSFFSAAAELRLLIPISVTQAFVPMIVCISYL